MWIQFKVGNYKSFKDVATFSMLAANSLKSDDKTVDENNVFDAPGNIRLLKSAAIYGANASGKSNLIAAMKFMRRFVLNSSRDTQSGEPIDVIPFRLSTETENTPSFFEAAFILEGTQYRYGFEVNTDRVVAEWLFYTPKIKEVNLFKRDGNEFKISKAFKESGEDLTIITRDNALLLSVSSQFNGIIARKILREFRNMAVFSSVNDIDWNPPNMRSFEKNRYKEEIIKLVKQLDTGIEDIKTQEVTRNFRSENLYNISFLDLILEASRDSKSFQENKSLEVVTAHSKYDQNGVVVGYEFLSMERDESTGTRKIFTIAATLLDTLNGRRVLIIDELDARLHPLITQAIIKLFNSKETNPNNAQLIFATHDTNLLSKDLFRRDQIWFTEKDKYDATSLYSLAEFKVRNDASFEKNYINGKYGAIPFIGDLSHIVEATGEQEETIE